jgi:hypothetical protein
MKRVLQDSHYHLHFLYKTRQFNKLERAIDDVQDAVREYNLPLRFPAGYDPYDKSVAVASPQYPDKLGKFYSPSTFVSPPYSPTRSSSSSGYESGMHPKFTFVH